MQLGRHIEKGFWAAADKGIVAAFGVFMLLVIRILPPEEFGNYLLIQYTFLILSHLASSLGMAPYVKYFYETDDRLSLQSNAITMMLSFFVLAIVLLWLFRISIGSILHSLEFSALFYFVPLLFLTAFGKLVVTEIFRATHEIHRIFWTDFVYYFVNVSLIVFFILQSRLDSAAILLQVNTLAFVCSSLFGFMLARRYLKLKFRLERQLFGRMYHFGKYAFGSGVTSVIYDRSDSYIVSAILNPQAVALIGAVRLFLRVYDLYKQAVALIAFPAFARLHSEKRRKEIGNLYEKGIFFSHLLLIPIMLILIGAANFFFDFILAGKYPSGPTILRTFAFLGLLVSWQAIGEGVLFGIGAVKYPFISRVIATISSLVLNIALISRFGVIGAAYASLASIGILAILTTHFVNRKIGVSFLSILARRKDLINFARQWMFSRKS